MRVAFLVPLIGILLLHGLTQAFIPLECVEQVQKGPLPTQCCPNNCGGSSRGQCAPLTLFNESVYHKNSPHLDDRWNWPGRFFSHLCLCKLKYYGVACQECYFGRSGTNCDEKDVRIRRNVLTFSSREKHKFREILKISRENLANFGSLIEEWGDRSDPLVKPKFVNKSVHYYLVHLHFYAQRSTLFISSDDCLRQDVPINFNHNGPIFLLWHRYFMLIWERELQKIAELYFGWHDFALPYWDWTDSSNCTVCTNDLLGKTAVHSNRLDSQSPFHNWEEFCTNPLDSRDLMLPKCFGCHYILQHYKKFNKLTRRWKFSTRKRFPTKKEVQFVLSRQQFYSKLNFSAVDSECLGFTEALEGTCGDVDIDGFATREPFTYMHNAVHDLISGSFRTGATSPNDPLFILHHTQVDRLLTSWLKRYGTQKAASELPLVDYKSPGHSSRSNLVGFIPTTHLADVMVPTEELGYDYDSFQFGAPDND